MIDAPELTEVDLVLPHGQPVVPVRVEPCACGGVIAAPDLDGMIAAAVFVHNASTGHVDYAHRTGTLGFALIPLPRSRQR